MGGRRHDKGRDTKRTADGATDQASASGVVAVVARGAWQAAPAVWLPALVLRTDRDIWHELGTAESQLNAQGHVYHYALRELETNRRGEIKDFWPASPAFASLDEARAAVEQRAFVDWDREPTPEA